MARHLNSLLNGDERARLQTEAHPVSHLRREWRNGKFWLQPANRTLPCPTGVGALPHWQPEAKPFSNERLDAQRDNPFFLYYRLPLLLHRDALFGIVAAQQMASANHTIESLLTGCITPARNVPALVPTELKMLLAMPHVECCASPCAVHFPPVQAAATTAFPVSPLHRGVKRSHSPLPTGAANAAFRGEVQSYPWLSGSCCEQYPLTGLPPPPKRRGRPPKNRPMSAKDLNSVGPLSRSCALDVCTPPIQRNNAKSNGAHASFASYPSLAYEAALVKQVVSQQWLPGGAHAPVHTALECRDSSQSDCPLDDCAKRRLQKSVNRDVERPKKKRSVLCRDGTLLSAKRQFARDAALSSDAVDATSGIHAIAFSRMPDDELAGLDDIAATLRLSPNYFLSMPQQPKRCTVLENIAQLPVTYANLTEENDTVRRVTCGEMYWKDKT